MNKTEDAKTFACDAIESTFSQKVLYIRLFPTGLCHHVFEVNTESGDLYVIRIARSETRELLKGGLYWHPLLQQIGIPVPKLYASEIGEPFSYMILERMQGKDLGSVYKQLKSVEKKRLAERMAAIQQTVGSLPASRSFGHFVSYEETYSPRWDTWEQVIEDGLTLSEARIGKVGVFSGDYIRRIREKLLKYRTHFQSVFPKPFLDDTTTKNVLVAGGELTAIVDTDELCFGDSLFVVGQTKMGLLSIEADTEYIDYWLDAVAASGTQRRVVDLYALVFCAIFMGEIGQTFNKTIEYRKEDADRLQAIFEKLVKVI